MSKRIGNVFIIEAEEPEQCSSCDKVEELRPVGPGGSRVCWNCHQNDPEGDRRFNAYMDGEPVP